MTKAEQIVLAIRVASEDTHPYDVIDELLNSLEYDVVEHETLDHTRWSVVESSVVKFSDGSFVWLTWEEPATEYQEGQPYNGSAELVEPYEETVIKYRKIK
jgi:hypothetical protein